MRELAAITFSDIRKAVTWGPSIRGTKTEAGGITTVVSLVPSDRLDENTAAAIAEVSQGPTGALRVKMHDDRSVLA